MSFRKRLEGFCAVMGWFPLLVNDDVWGGLMDYCEVGTTGTCVRQPISAYVR